MRWCMMMMMMACGGAKDGDPTAGGTSAEVTGDDDDTLGDDDDDVIGDDDDVIGDDDDDLDTATDDGDPNLGPATTTDLFGDANHAALRVVLHHRAGAAPRAGALELVQASLQDLHDAGHIRKPGGIQVELGVTDAVGTGAAYTFEELDQDLEAVRGDFVVGDAAVIHGYYTDGSYDNGGEGTVLGFAYGGARLVMMRDEIDEACEDPILGLLGGDEVCDQVEATVLLHEIGHLFGLVNNGVPMVDDHQDEAHGKHDDDEGCLMYWAVETPQVADVVADSLSGAGGITPFDDACLADLGAAL